MIGKSMRQLQQLRRELYGVRQDREELQQLLQQKQLASVQDIVSGFLLPGIQFTTAALSSSTAAAGQLTGSAPIIIMNNSGGTPGTYTTRTATQMIADSSLGFNASWWILLVNGQGTGTLTLAGGTGVTVSGTATVAVSTARFFSAKVSAISTPAIVITDLGFSFTATALAFGA